jgi:hypothetical protein
MTKKETTFFGFRSWMNGNEKQFSPISEFSQWDIDHDDTQSWVSFKVFASKEEAETVRAAEMAACGL